MGGPMKPARARVVLILPLLFLTALAGCAGNGPGGDGAPARGREVWAGTFEGSVVGPAVCFFGTDSYYQISGIVFLDVPAPGLEAALSTFETTTFPGTVSIVEIGIESTGDTGCDPPPTVASRTADAVPLSVRTVQRQFQLRADEVLIGGVFLYGGVEDAMNAQNIYLNTGTYDAESVTGSWAPQGGYGGGGEFELARLWREPDAGPADEGEPPVSVRLSADQLTGFLTPGTQVQLTVEATDADGNDVPCNPVWRVSNPVDSTVVQEPISPAGVMTIGPDDGAASVWASCDGVGSNGLLVSSTG